jgi:hypothetical protein
VFLKVLDFTDARGVDLLATPRPSQKEEAERQRARGLVRDLISGACLRVVGP